MLHKEYTKERILYYAIKLFGKKGYERVSVREIARAVGIKESSIYNHYQNKEDILDHVMEYFVRRHTTYTPRHQDVEKRLETETPRQILESFFYMYDSQEYETLINMYRVLIMEQYRNEKFRNLFLDFFVDQQTDNLLKSLEIMVEKGAILPNDLHAITQLWMRSSMIAVMLACHTSKQDPDPYYGGIGQFLIGILVEGAPSELAAADTAAKEEETQ